MKDKKWVISTDSIGSDFDCGDFSDTKEEAIVAFRKDLADGDYDDVKKQGFFWVGQTVAHSVTRFFNADEVIDRAADIADDVGGEFAEDYPDVTQEARDELDELLLNWATKYSLEPNFYEIINSEKVNI